jgi:hypothetical protein
MPEGGLPVFVGAAIREAAIWSNQYWTLRLVQAPTTSALVFHLLGSKVGIENKKEGRQWDRPSRFAGESIESRQGDRLSIEVN